MYIFTHIRLHSLMSALTYVCTHLRLHSLTSAFTDVCTHLCLHSLTSALTDFCIHSRLHSLTSALTYVCTHLRLYLQKFALMYSLMCVCYSMCLQFIHYTYIDMYLDVSECAYVCTFAGNQVLPYLIYQHGCSYIS